MIMTFALFPKIWIGLRNSPKSHPPLVHKYTGQYVKSRSDVANEVIVIRKVLSYTICHPTFISELNLTLSCTKHGFWKCPESVSIFNLLFIFETETKTWVYQKDVKVMALLKFDLHCDLVTLSVTSWVYNTELAKLGIPISSWAISLSSIPRTIK